MIQTVKKLQTFNCGLSNTIKAFSIWISYSVFIRIENNKDSELLFLRSKAIIERELISFDLKKRKKM